MIVGQMDGELWQKLAIGLRKHSLNIRIWTHKLRVESLAISRHLIGRFLQHIHGAWAANLVERFAPILVGGFSGERERERSLLRDLAELPCYLGANRARRMNFFIPLLVKFHHEELDRRSKELGVGLRHHLFVSVVRDFPQRSRHLLFGRKLL